MRFVLLEAPTAEATPAEETTQQTAGSTTSDDLGYDPSKMTKGKGLNDEFVKGLISLDSREIDRIIDYDRESGDQLTYKQLKTVGKNFVDSLKRIVDLKIATPKEVYDWLSKNDSNLSVLSSNKEMKKFFYLTGKLVNTADAELHDSYLNPSLYKRDGKEFEYTATVLVTLSSPYMRNKYFGEDASKVSIEGLMDGNNLKPSGINQRKRDGGETIYGQIEAWSGRGSRKSNKRSYESFKKAYKDNLDSGKIENGTTINIDCILTFKNGKWIEAT